MKAGLFILGLILLSLNTNAKFSQVINISSNIGSEWKVKFQILPTAKSK